MKITITKQEYQTIVRCLKTSEILIRGYNLRDEDIIRKTRKKLQRSKKKVDMTFEEMKAQYCGKNIRKKPKDEEHKIQVAMVKWFRMQYPSMQHNLFAVPNGGRRDAATGAKLKDEGVLAGVADLILLKSNRFYGALLIETKTQKGSQSHSQKEWETKITADGYKYVVVRSLEEFIEVVNSYLAEK